MEPDRYQCNRQLYIFGMLCLLISAGALLFFFYTAPNLVFGWHYDVPEFLAFWRVFLVLDFGLTENAASRFIALFLLMIAILFGCGAYYASTRLDNLIYGIDMQSASRPRLLTPELKESLNFFIKALGLIALFLGAIILFQWLIYIPPSIP